ncbi:alpha-2,3-sialyltransferase, partial [Campylobacter coli]|nr:alpha-2,3-sialyltransferase [Campylobacter coli]
LLSIVILYKQEQKIRKNSLSKLPFLGQYLDYQEAVKLKNHLSYKLGQAFIKANKTWYKGGYIKFIFEVWKLKKKFKKK